MTRILTPEPAKNLIPDSIKNTAYPDPTRYDSRSQVCDPWSRPFQAFDLLTTLQYYNGWV